MDLASKKNIIFCIANQKGGVGKTTTAINLAHNFAMIGKKTLLIDFDPQGNASSGLGKRDKIPGIYEAMQQVDANNFVCSTSHPNLFIITSSVDLAAKEIALVNEPNREYRLKQVIDSLKVVFDYIIIDTSPSLGLLTINALVASDYVVSPVQSEFYALEGLSLFLETIARVKNSFNPSLQLLGLLITMCDRRNLYHKEVIDNLKVYFKNFLFETTILRNIRLAESVSFGKSISDYDKYSSGAKLYSNLADEIIAKMLA